MMGNREEQEALGKLLLEESEGSYLRYRVLDDGSLAIFCRLAFTKAIMVGVTYQEPYERRYCFEDFALAEAEFEALTHKGHVPNGFIATRPQGLQQVPTDFEAWDADRNWLVEHCLEEARDLLEGLPEGKIPHPMDLMKVLCKVTLNPLGKVEYCQALHAMCERRIDEMKIPRGLWTPMYRTICEVGHEH